jgi:hypothetical protein
MTQVGKANCEKEQKQAKQTNQTNKQNKQNTKQSTTNKLDRTRIIQAGG